MLSVSRRVAAADDLPTTLAHIAREAVGVVTARAGSIVLLGPRSQLRLGEAWGLSPAYRRTLEHAPSEIVRGAWPSGLAIAEGRSIVVSDILADRRFAAWHGRAAAEGYRSLVSTPLTVDDQAVGALNVYRGVPCGGHRTTSGCSPSSPSTPRPRSGPPTSSTARTGSSRGWRAS